MFVTLLFALCLQILETTFDMVILLKHWSRGFPSLVFVSSCWCLLIEDGTCIIIMNLAQNVLSVCAVLLLLLCCCWLGCWCVFCALIAATTSVCLVGVLLRSIDPALQSTSAALLCTEVKLFRSRPRPCRTESYTIESRRPRVCWSDAQSDTKRYPKRCPNMSCVTTGPRATQTNAGPQDGSKDSKQQQTKRGCTDNKPHGTSKAPAMQQQPPPAAAERDSTSKAAEAKKRSAVAAVKRHSERLRRQEAKQKKVVAGQAHSSKHQEQAPNAHKAHACSSSSKAASTAQDTNKQPSQQQQGSKNNSAHGIGRLC